MKARVLLATTLASLGLIHFAGAAEDGFVSIFDGKTLAGWEGNTAIWSAKDGTITGQTTAETNLKHNTFLVWKGGTVDNFELRLSYRIVAGNSGIQYRSRVAEQGAQGPIVGGYQADFEAGKTYSGILYEERGRGILAQRGQAVKITAEDGGKHKVTVTGEVGKSDAIQAAIKPEGWNDYVVVAKGNHLTHSINGHTTVDVIDEDAVHAAQSGVLALQVHVGPPMTVQFKDVRIKKLGAENAAGNDLDAIQGTWVGLSGKKDGEAIPAEWLKSLSLKITANKYEVAWQDGGDTGSLKLKNADGPKHMDITSDGAGVIEGIYELKEGKLQVAYSTDGGGRPKNFEGKEGTAITYVKK